MKVAVAIDSFKGSMTSMQAGRSWRWLHGHAHPSALPDGTRVPCPRA